jgi:hypothetical protein
MELTTLLIFLIIFVIFFSISFMIQDMKYRICYYGILVLIGLSILNIYLSIVYYIQLRNTTGVQGKMGPKGLKGSMGTSGSCSFQTDCGIKNARGTILNVANEMYDIDKKCLDNPSLTNCKTQDILEQAVPINKQINMLEKIAYSSTIGEADFVSKLKVCLQDSNSCTDSTDF